MEYIEGKILIADDNPANLGLLKRLLVGQGYTVLTTEDSREALHLAFTQHPDLIILDIMMPGMSGFDVCERLKSDYRTEHIPVIFISGRDEVGMIVEAFEKGGVDYITRPFNHEEVVARVRSHLTLVDQRTYIESLRERERQQFEDITQMKNHFIGTATHDLKNPLLIILSYVALLENQPDIMQNEVVIESMLGIRKGVDRISRLITDMLDLVQMESSITLSLSDVMLGIYLHECMQGFEVLAAQNIIMLSFVPPQPDKVIRLDKKRMKRVIDNLISNAIKYTPPGGKVEVKASWESGSCVIEVADSGIGIPAESIPHVFDKFYRVPDDNHQQIEGTGLGLSVVQAIVQQHNGEIYVVSEPGRGSNFTILLPSA